MPRRTAAPAPTPVAAGPPDGLALSRAEMRTIPTTASTTAAMPRRGSDSPSTARARSMVAMRVDAGQRGRDADRQGAARHDEGPLPVTSMMPASSDDRPGGAPARRIRPHQRRRRRSATVADAAAGDERPQPGSPLARRRRRAGRTRAPKPTAAECRQHERRGARPRRVRAAGGADRGQPRSHAEPLRAGRRCAPEQEADDERDAPPSRRR